MKTKLSLILCLVGLGGCFSTQLTPPPEDLDSRLETFIEMRGNEKVVRELNSLRRLAADDAQADEAPLVMANRPPSFDTQLAVARDQGWRNDLGGHLLMTDVGDQPAAETQTDDQISVTERNAEREEKYLRRPPLPSFWDTVKRDLKCLPRDIWHDTKRVYANPVNLVILGTGLAGSIAIKETGVDYHIENHFNQRNDFEPAHHHFKEDWRDAFGAMGNPGTHFALAGIWYLIGQQSMDDKTYEVGKTLFSALTINGVTVMMGQAMSYDRAPNGEVGTFPSGHTSSSFVVASVLHEAYGHIVGVPLYGLAVLAGMERIEDGEHYTSDVVMGAILGSVVGHSVASGRDPEFFGWKILPYASTQGGTGVAFMKTFD
jgi:hypothetical protein